MIRLSMNEMTTYGWSFDEDVANFVRAGYQGIGVCREKLSMYGEEAGIHLLIESGLSVSSLSFCGGFTGKPSQTRTECIADSERAVHLACSIDADCVIVQAGGRSGHTLNHARRLIREGIHELAMVAEASQVNLAIEPMHVSCTGGQSVLHSLQHAVDLIDEVPSDCLKIAFDAYHLGFGEIDFRLIEEIASRVAVVQLGDALTPPTCGQNRCPIGRGIVPISEIIGALNAGGYSGFYEIELRGADVEFMLYDDILAESLEASLALARA
jgi:sugar phosphate isomerase/epimerase